MVDNKSDSSDPKVQSTPVNSDVALNTSRRRLTGAGLGMSAIFTLASRPVLAVQCAPASAAASGNLSPHGTPPQCTGRTPGYWKVAQHGDEWRAPYKQGTCNDNAGGGGDGGCANSPTNWVAGTAFHPEFYGTKFIVSNKSLSMNQVMVLNDSSYLGLTDKDNLGSHIVAALLNAVSGKTDGVLTVATVKSMWSECQIKGYFEPIAGVKWTPAQVVTYLKSTMI